MRTARPSHSRRLAASGRGGVRAGTVGHGEGNGRPGVGRRTRGTPRARLAPASTPRARSRSADPASHSIERTIRPSTDRPRTRRRPGRRPGRRPPRTGSSSRTRSCGTPRGRTPVRRAWTSRFASQWGRNRTGRRRVRVRQRRTGRSTSSPPASSRYVDKVRGAPRPRFSVGDVHSGPRRDVLPGRGPECPQVRADKVLEALRLGRVVGPDPVLGQAEPVGAASLPGA